MDRRAGFETVELDLKGEIYVMTVRIASDADAYDVNSEFDGALAAVRKTGLEVRDVLRRAERAVDAPDES